MNMCERAVDIAEVAVIAIAAGMRVEAAPPPDLVERMRASLPAMQLAKTKRPSGRSKA